jgi:sugar/nucleoside kinase (ribokinase family)
VTCSDAFVVQHFGDAFREALKQADLLFCNTSEACAVTGASTAEEAFSRMRTEVPSAVVTAGPGGAFVRHAGVETHVPTFPCEPRDLTGAGDMFAGAFLYGITQGIVPDRAARAGCFLAMKVITQVGARLHHGTRHYWEQALSAP